LKLYIDNTNSTFISQLYIPKDTITTSAWAGVRIGKEDAQGTYAPLWEVSGGEDYHDEDNNYFYFVHFPKTQAEKDKVFEWAATDAKPKYVLGSDSEVLAGVTTTINDTEFSYLPNMLKEFENYKKRQYWYAQITKDSVIHNISWL